MLCSMGRFVMNYSEVIAKAKECIGDKCHACPVCNGRACRNVMPGPGSKGVGDTAIRNYDKWQEIRVNMDTLCEGKPVDTSLTLFGKHFKAPFFAGDDMIGALGLCGLAGASTVVFISGYVQKYGARFFSVAGGCVLLAAWLLAFWGNDSYLWIIIAILLIDAGMQCIHLSNQTSVVALDASAINRINTVYMTIYFLGGSAGTFVSGLSWQHYGWTGVVGVGVAFTVASLLVNCIKPNGKPQTGRVGLTCET